MWRNTRMKSTNNFVKNMLLFTYIFIIFSKFTCLKTVFFINHLPNCWSIVVGKWLDIFIKVKILSFVILLIFYVPNPSKFVIDLCFVVNFFSLFFPDIYLASELFFYFISLFKPLNWNISLITSTDCTTFWLTNSISSIQLTLSVEIHSNHSKIFSFYQRM